MFRTFERSEIRIVVAILLVVAGLGIGMSYLLPIIQAGENWTRDIRFAALARHEPQNADVVVVAITEDTLAKLPYRSPVDRGFLARLLRSLDAAGPRGIGIDILFDQPTEPAKDAALRQAFGELSVPVVLVSGGKTDGLTEKQIDYLRKFTDGLTTAPGNLVKDRADGTVRWTYGGSSAEGGWSPGFVGALAGAVGATPPREDTRLVYRHGPDDETSAIASFPAHVAAVLPKKWFAGKVVLIGADLPLIDRHRTPFAAARGVRAGTLPGVVIHALALAQVLDDRRPPDVGAVGQALVMVAAAVVGMGLAMLDASLAAMAAVFVVAVTILWIGGFAVYWMGAVMLPLLTPTLTMALSTGAGIAYLGKRDRAQKRFIRQAFSRYVSRAIVDDLVKRPDQLRLGGERRELTYLFTDLANFTSFTERTEPGVLVPLLNQYLSTMCEILFDHGATIDKIVGDAVVGFFNAPVEQADHAQRAVAAALDMDAFGQRYVAEKWVEGLTLGITRIGIHSGTAIIGNFGGNRFFDYTAHGDMVNTAARLESVNKHLGTRVCVSIATTAQCPDRPFRPVGALVLKGRSMGLEVFEPVAEDQRDSSAIVAYGHAYDLLKSGSPDAIDAFRKVLEMAPGDGLARFHLQRLESGESGATIVMAEK